MVLDAAWAGLRIAVGGPDSWEYPVEIGAGRKDKKAGKAAADGEMDGWIVIQE